MKNNIKFLRKRAKMSQLQLQMATGIEQALLSKYENEIRTPPTETLIILADFFHVSIDFLLARSEKEK